MGPDKLKEIAEAEKAKQAEAEHMLNVCVAAGCLSNHSDQILEGLENELKNKDHKCDARGVGCMGLCSAGPLVTVDDESVMYSEVQLADAARIVEEVAAGSPQPKSKLGDTPFFKRQKKIVLENSGLIDPERIEEYIAVDGYSALVTALTEKTPNEVIEDIIKSGLRGRGGAGYPTGLKWSTVAKAQGAQKYVVCNADEGDPGAFMDRSILESDPHRVLEGMAIGAYAVGANLGYIYVRAEYPLAIARLRKAIRQAERKGLLGNQIAETNFNFRVEIRLGAGAFVCGEETALIHSIEGKRGTPRPRPPYPAQKGIRNDPTLINNVETFANIAPILRNGGDWFAGIGTEKSKGTKVFALAGQVINTGLIEVPMGITLREIVFDIGGGIPDGKKFKAVQTGGPSGGCIPEQFLDMPVDYESLGQVGSIMGSGGMIIMDETSSMVDVARYFMEFCMTESCGKCIPCRAGTAQIHDLLLKFIRKQATQADLALLEDLCDVVKNTSLCGLGQSAPNPVLSTLKYFRQEYLDLMVDGADVQEGEMAGMEAGS